MCAKRALVGVLMTMGLTALVPASALGLPAGWGYELISPANTDGIDIFGAIGASDGDHAWVQTTSSREQSSGNISVLAAHRTPTGWQLQDTARTGAAFADFSYSVQARSADSESVVMDVCRRALLGCLGNIDFDRVGPGNTHTTLLSAPHLGTFDDVPLLVAASDDLSRIIVQQGIGNLPLLPGEDTHTSGHGLYSAGDNGPEFLGYDENGNVLDCGAVLGAGADRGFEQTGASADAQTVAFTSPDPASGCPNPPDIYVRRGGQSFVISRPANPALDVGSSFAGMSRSGDEVFFTTQNQLVTDDTDAATDLYKYNLPTHTLTRITPDADVTSVGVAPNGAYVYFTAANPINGQGTPSGRNLWVYHNNDNTIHLLISAPDGAIRRLGFNMTSGQPSPITPDGRHLVFGSNLPLTGIPTGGTFQIFQIDGETGPASLVCTSCRPDGQAASNDASLAGAISPPTTADTHLQSDDGHTVVFQTKEPLAPEDTNGLADVYIWKDGTLSLITSGHSNADFSSLVNVTADGNSVFFQAAEDLLPGPTQGAQTNLRMYVARAGGGFPTLTPAPSCAPGACQPNPTPGPGLPDPASRHLTHHATPHKTAKPRSKLTLARITRAARNKLARTGTLTLHVHTNRPGTITATLRAHNTRLAHAQRKTSHPATLTLTLHLNPTARNKLTHTNTLKLTITNKTTHTTITTTIKTS